jgi:hypothetical protein
VYDHARARNVETVRTWLAQHDIILAGRYSEWEYYNSDHAFLAGRKAAEKVREQQGQDRQLVGQPAQERRSQRREGTVAGAASAAGARAARREH